MKSTSRGRAQRIAKHFQQERCWLWNSETICIEKGIEERQEILKFSRRNNGVIRIPKLARKLHGNRF